MMRNPSVVRRAYDLVALFSLLHVVAFAGIGAFLFATGAIDGPKLGDMVQVLRGGRVVGAGEEEHTPEPTGESVEAGEVEGGQTTDASGEGLELLRLEANRIKTELDQRLALNNSILLRVTMEREAFRKEQQAAAASNEAARAERQNEGFTKQLAIFQSLSPKIAVEHLLSLRDPDEAARLLREMDTRKAKKIVEAAKTGARMASMKDILRRLRDVAPGRSDELDPTRGG